MNVNSFINAFCMFSSLRYVSVNYFISNGNQIFFCSHMKDNQQKCVGHIRELTSWNVLPKVLQFTEILPIVPQKINK